MDLKLKNGKEVNIEISELNTIAFSSNVTDTSVTPPVPFDFTGGVLTLTVFTTKERDANPLIELSSEVDPGGITLTTGLAVFWKEQAVPKGKYYYYLDFHDSSSTFKTWWQGKFIIS